MKYITKNNIEVEVLAPYEPIDNDKLKYFNVCEATFEYMGATTCTLKNGETRMDDEYIVKYPDGTCHVYNKELFEMLFGESQYHLLIEKMKSLCEHVKDVENKNGVSIIVPNKYIGYFTTKYEVKGGLSDNVLKTLSITSKKFMDIKIEFEEIDEPYIKIKLNRKDK